MSEPGNWPRGALPLGPSAYEDAMTDLYNEAVWRERNFYRADEEPAGSSTEKTSTTPPGVTPPPVTNAITQPMKDFSDFLSPNGVVSWPRALIVVGGLLLVGYIIGKKVI